MEKLYADDYGFTMWYKNFYGINPCEDDGHSGITRGLNSYIAWCAGYELAETENAMDAAGESI
jgi:hypothetical protein